MEEYIKSDRSIASCGGIRLIRQIWSNFPERSNWREIAPCRGAFKKIHDFEPKTHLEIVLGIGGGSPMNESDLLMTSLPHALPPIGRYHNSSSLNYIDVGTCVYGLASGVCIKYCTCTTSRRQSSHICVNSSHRWKIPVLKTSA